MIPNVSDTVLASRLRRLESEGLLGSLRADYHLTDNAARSPAP